MCLKGKVSLRIVSMILFMAVVLTGLPFSGPFSVVAYGASGTERTVGESGYQVETTVTFRGQPVKDKTVHLHCQPDKGSNFKVAARTDIDGMVSFDSLPAGECYFTIEASDSDDFSEYDGKFSGQTFHVPQGPVPLIELEEGETISFSVSLENGQKLDELSVALCFWSPKDYISKDIWKLLSAPLGSNPTITFSNLPKWDKCSIRIDRVEGQNIKYWGEDFGEYFSIPGSAPDIVLEAGYSGSTRVTLDGVPQKGAYVNVEGVHDNISVKTDSNGVATFTNLPSAQSAYFTVFRKKGEFAAYNGANEGKVFATTDGNYPNIELKKGRAFTAKFLDRGKPLTNTLVHVCQLDAMNETWTVADEVTDQNGTATFTNVPAGGNYYFILFNRVSETVWKSFYSGEDLPKYTLPADITIDISDNPSGGSSTGSRRKDKNDNSGNWNQSYTAPKLGGSAPAPISGPVNTETAVNLTREALKVAGQAGNTSAVVKFRNVGAMTLATARAIGEAAGTTPVKIYADSTLGDGTVDVRLTLSPAQMTKDIDLSASTVSERAKSTKALFGKWFKNRLQVISFTQQGSFGMPVEIAVKPDKELDQKSLYFYHYDKETNSYKQIPAPNYWMDENGYLHFTTSLAGDVIITDAPLQK